MHKNYLIGLACFILLCPLFLVCGCGDKEKTDAGAQSKLVAKKIKPISSAKPSESKAEPTQSAAEKAVEDDTPPKDAQAVAGDETEGSIELYDPEGKIDPFSPLFQEEDSSSLADTKSYKKNRRGHLTPLEKVDLSQLHLLGIILAESGNRAMVADSTGKGYVVTIGTYIGMSSGRVIDILRDRIIVEEEVENILGKISLRKRELKLQKLTGD